MKILIFGAGVIGSIYAAKLHEACHDVSLLARGQRYEELQRNGVIIRNSLTKKQITATIPCVRELKPDDFYDLVIITVRLEQMDAVIPILKENPVCTLIMFMLNNPGDMALLSHELNPKHIILGFPGIGGVKRETCIDYILIRQQKTTIGEVYSKRSDSLIQVKNALETAGFPTEICADMPAWLITHAIFVSCMAAAIVRENGDSVQLSKKTSRVASMVRAIREGFLACKALGMPIEPTNLKIIFMIMPRWFSILYWQNALKGKIGTLALAPHANSAKREMQLLAGKVMTRVHSSPLHTPILDELLSSFIKNSY